MEETLYDIYGMPVAYIAYGNESVIYLWQGKHVAYLSNDCIYGFNGRHLGWYENGVVWNTLGLVNGFNRSAADVYVQLEPFKGYKEYLPYKSFKEFAHLKPIYHRTKSHESLVQLLMRGAK